jgi:signal transduction histidine kinase
VHQRASLCGLAWLDWKDDNQKEERERALAEAREANRRLETTLAENAGLHEQLLTQAREAGILDERQRMAGEIHDTLAQGLTGIITQLQAAEQASGDTSRWGRHVAAATRLARESLSEARRSVDALRPELLERALLSDALAGVAERWSALHAIPVQVTTTGTVRRVPPDAEFALLRAAQEALANVAKHARASRVGLTLSYMDDEVALDVRDDGRGFDGSAGSAGGFGLAAMRQRIEGLSGSLQVESEPGGGTAISACVPAGPAPAAAPGREMAPAPAEAAAPAEAIA